MCVWKIMKIVPTCHDPETETFSENHINEKNDGFHP